MKKEELITRINELRKELTQRMAFGILFPDNEEKIKEYHNLIMKAYKNEDINKINKLSDEVIKNYQNLRFQKE